MDKQHILVAQALKALQVLVVLEEQDLGQQVQEGMVDKAELANLNRSLAAIDAEARKLAESPNADRGRALNTQREQLTAAKQKLVDKFKGGGAAPKATESPADDELVSVTNPQGKPVRIRKSQLEQALASGYTER